MPPVAKKKFNDQPFPYHHELTLEITTLTNLGVGLGRVARPGPQVSGLSPQVCSAISAPSAPSPPSGGWVVMVPFTLPGARERARKPLQSRLVSPLVRHGLPQACLRPGEGALP